MRFMKRFLIPSVLFLLAGMARAGSLAPDLQQKVSGAGPKERLRVIVRLDREADLAMVAKDGRQGMVRAL